MTPLQLLSNHYVGKTIASFQFSNGETPEDTRAQAIGKKITKVNFGFNDSREDAGIILHVEDVGEVVFIYDNEEVSFKE